MIRALLAALLCAGALQAAPWPRTTHEVANDRALDLSPADEARPGLLVSATLSPAGTRVLCRAETGRDGHVVALDWSAESGAREVDLPDDAFWAILDHYAEGGEWLERAPSSLTAAQRALFPAGAAQAFALANGRLLAATNAPSGATRLRVAFMGTRTAEHRPVFTLLPFKAFDLPGAALVSRIPCRSKGGACEERWRGKNGADWTLRRTHPDSSWQSLRYVAHEAPWWDGFDWDSLRRETPQRDFRLLLTNWIGTQGDLLIAQLLEEAQPLFAFGVEDWRRRRLAGLDPARLADSLTGLPSPPARLIIYRSQTGRQHAEVGFDLDGRRWVEVTRPARSAR